MPPPLPRLCPNYVLHGVPQRLMQTFFDIYAPPVTLQHPAPTQVILQVVRRHAMETLHPLFQPMVIPVHVLDAICTDHPFALAIVHYLMGYALCLAKTAYTPAPSLHNTASGDTNGFNTAMTASAFIFSS